MKEEVRTSPRFLILNSYLLLCPQALGRRLNPLGESIDHPNGHAVKTLESKETRAQREKTLTHNSVFAAHRLKCRISISRSISGIFLSSPRSPALFNS